MLCLLEENGRKNIRGHSICHSPGQKLGPKLLFVQNTKKKEMYYGRTCNCKAFGKCLKLCQWDKYSCTEGRRNSIPRNFKKFHCVVCLKNELIYKEALQTELIQSYSQRSKEPKHYKSRCSTTCTGKKCKCSCNFKFSTRELGIPLAEVYIPFEKYDYSSGWARCSKWKNCCYLHWIEHSFQNSKINILNVQYQGYNRFHKTSPLSTWIPSYSSQKNLCIKQHKLLADHNFTHVSVQVQIGTDDDLEKSKWN